MQDEEHLVLVLTIRGIESEIDGFPGAEQRPLWDPAALAVKDAELEAYFERVGPVFREACVHLAAKWRDE